MGAEEPVAYADAVLRRERGGEVGAVPPLHDEGDDADARRVVTEEREHPDLGDLGEFLAHPGHQLLLALDEPVEPGLGERLAGRGDRVHADDVRRAGLVAGFGGVPLDVHTAVGPARDLAAGATAGEIRLRLPEPVGAAREHPGAERRVQLVTGEGDPVHVQLRDVHGVVGGELRGVEDHAGAVGVRDGGQFPYGPQLAGDVGGAGDADQRGGLRVAPGQCPLQRGDGLLGVRGAFRKLTGASRQGSSDAWCSVSKTNTSQPAGSTAASRFSESVVDRVKTTWSSSRQPRKPATVRRLFSKRSVESCERYPAPRWTLP